MDAQTVTATLAKPIARELLDSAMGRFSYLGADGEPRVIPIGFWTKGEQIAFATVVGSAKVAAISENPRVALVVDRFGMPPRSLLVRGSATVEIVDGVPAEYLAGAPKLMPAEAVEGWRAGVQALYSQMAVITITPDHVVLHDFETTLPKAVADLVAQHGDPR
ncbi:pyridoxamine 5'-phosphate oxidase family protein [Pseudonocardia sp. CA-107938]|uniref:pyridoxamine 5'-phosphate oxidase family protein n=1 Tax=Pseudonocardia sp. CA-107938 TaxID=3240021 RepID=UPI003D91E89E